MYSFDDQLESIVNTRSMMKRCSTRWLENMIACGKVCETMFHNFMQAAADSEELTSGNRDIEEISLGTWSLMVGYFQTVRLHQCWQDGVCMESEGKPPALAADNVHIRSMQRLVNTYDWQQKVSNDDINKICRCLADQGFR